MLALAGCGRAGAGEGGPTVPVVVSAPVSSEPWVARSIEGGARLAVEEINEAGGLDLQGGKRRLELVVLDHGSSPATALANAREAVRRKAAVLLTDGTGVASTADVTGPAQIPTFILFQGGRNLINPQRWPHVFRLAPADAIMTRRLADYIAPANPKVALLSDDTDYGEQGREALRDAFEIDEVEVVSEHVIPRAARDLAPQVLQARRAGANRVVVWAGAATVAATVEAVHQAGWDVEVLAGQTAEDPLVRQRLAAHPEWMRSLKFVSSRITAEVGPKPFEAFRKRYEDLLGTDKVGVEQDGRDVIQPPDWAMYPYDALKLVAEAVDQVNTLGQPMLDTLNGGASIIGANGDQRSYNAEYHEGISPTDTYIAGFDGFVFGPVDDDPLAGLLHPVDQLD
ncbi:ABC transporter substrate-binding protein [Solirubrobacter deserti]|uniref:ABC transporter substrate-binding protein n=1 Tax=Solirubrobacter deserti TaxID=2282478 RepID=A0ABT4RUJ0_9ACTN|nr:ABC transporter substrate-binding protein [Solirubrobacter deserti]MDA0142253.1 ABC transporter substrate-binding protein [Solirubrobacter deserti]